MITENISGVFIKKELLLMFICFMQHLPIEIAKR